MNNTVSDPTWSCLFIVPTSNAEMWYMCNLSRGGGLHLHLLLRLTLLISLPCLGLRILLHDIIKAQVLSPVPASKSTNDTERRYS